jgi:hypothetical protein
MPPHYTPPRSKLKREADLEDLVRRYTSGETRLAVLAEIYGVSPAQIANDLRSIQKRWRASEARDWDMYRGRELAKLDRIEEAAWDGWRRSMEDKEHSTVEQKQGFSRTNGTKTAIRREGQAGNHNFLLVIEKCIARRIEILGLASPIDVRHHVGGSIEHRLAGPRNPALVAAEQAAFEHLQRESLALGDGARDDRDPGGWEDPVSAVSVPGKVLDGRFREADRAEGSPDGDVERDRDRGDPFGGDL